MSQLHHDELRQPELPDFNWRDYATAPALNAVGEAALGAFTELGYHGTTVREIARRAGMSVPGLYYHFASKQDILVALLRSSNDEIMRRSRAALREGNGSPRRRFIMLVENIVLYMAHRRQQAHLAREIKSLEEPHRRQHIARRDELEIMLRREVELAHDRCEFAAPDSHETTRAVWVLCRGVADWYVIDGAKTPAELAAAYVSFALAIVGDVATSP